MAEHMMSKRQMMERMKLKEAAMEMKKNPPGVLAKTRKKKGRKMAEKQRVAILLSKAGMSKK